MFINYKEIFMMPLVKPISIIAPVYNEEQSAIESIKSLLSLEYPQYEVIVVNDGSTDKTLKKLIKAFNLKKTKWVYRKSIETKPIKAIYKSLANSKLIVVDKKNGKKADAMNAGLNISHYPLFCGIDGDSVLEKDALLKMVRPFLEDPEKTVAAGGIIRLSNGTEVKDGQVTKIKMPRNWFARFQILEYLRAFLGGRLGLSMLRSMLIVSGAFGLFRKDIVLKCGGYRPETIGEDMDLVVRMRKYLHEQRIPFRVAYIPDPICWTEAPETARSLANQRIRWHKGLIESLLFSKKMIFNPRYGTTGIIAMPFYFIFEMIGPLIEVAGYTSFAILVLLGELNRPFALLFFLLAIVFGILLSILAVLLGEYSSRSYPRISYVFIITLFSFLENLVYRQFISIVRAKAFIDVIKKNQEWGVMDKKGFSVAKQKS
jgi:cellulose synthase/poly-beta-1,6-N-acetylglucosamine synthase-like glycosyltransferase